MVTLSGRDFYLGPHGSEASLEEYDRLLTEWIAGGRRLPSGDAAYVHLTVVELIARYYAHAQCYHVKNGEPTRELNHIRRAMFHLQRAYGRTPAASFGPKALKSIRQSMIAAEHSRRPDHRLSRTYINDMIGRIKRMFRWAVEEELVPPSTYHGLQAVAGLRRGRGGRKARPVTPVPDQHVEAVRPHVAPQVWAMVELQRLTGMRSGEVTIMRGCDSDMTGRLWLYRPSSHKTEHHGHERVVQLGPRAQGIIRLFLKADLVAYLFSPADAEAVRNAERRRQRRSPMTLTQARRSRKRNPKRMPRDHYSVDTYGRAIRRGCDRAGVPEWTPHRLRHSYATRIRKEYGIEAARVMLGHQHVGVTEIYPERDLAVAATIAAKHG